MTRHRLPTGLFAIGWLFLLHALADLFVGVFRCHDIHRELTDVLAAALPRAQICLLAIWLALGSQRLSWRVCGLIAGTCFLMLIFSRFLFPGQYGLGYGTGWLDEEWAFYFRLSGPGDLLIKLPILVAGVALPLVTWRVWRAGRNARQAGRPWARWVDGIRLQFRFQDMAIWTVTICLVLVVLYRTAPYPGWLEELFGRCRRIYLPDRMMGEGRDRQAVYTIASALLYVLVAHVSLGAVHSKTPLWCRVPLAAVLVLVPAYGFEVFLRRVVLDPEWTGTAASLWGQASAETWNSALAAVTIAGSLWLVRMYETYWPARLGAAKPDS